MELTEKAVSSDMLLRRARKVHRCQTRRGLRAWDGGELPLGHSGQIGVGEQYVEYMGESHAYQSGHRYCNACSIAAGLLAPVTAVFDMMAALKAALRA